MAEARALSRMLKRMNAIGVQATNFREDSEVGEIKGCLYALQNEWVEFLKLEREQDGKFNEANAKILEEIESVQFKASNLLHKLIGQKEVATPNHPGDLNATMNQTLFLRELAFLNKGRDEINLPNIDIEPFSGDYFEFPSFRDLYESAIHNNERLSNVTKFKYLKGLLKGEAAELIKHTMITEAEYTEAWRKIKLRYDKPKLIISDLISQFLMQPIIKRPSAKALHSMAAITDQILDGLRTLGTRAERKDPWLIHILLNKLDDVTKTAWGDEVVEEEYPTIQSFVKFLNKKADGLETVERSQMTMTTPSVSQVRVNHISLDPIVLRCTKCSENHYVNECPRFLELNCLERRGFVANRRLCFNCLSGTHLVGACKSRYRCNKCRRKHHTTLHMEELSNLNSGIGESDVSSRGNSENSDVQVNTLSLNESTFTLLPTVVANVSDIYGEYHPCRLLLDSGSQVSCISESCVQRLMIPRRTTNTVISGIAGKTTSKGEVSISLRSRDMTKSIELNALILEKLPIKVPAQEQQINLENPFKHINLADERFYKSGNIDILIGADKFFSIVQNGKMYNKTHELIAQNSLFGWVISGNFASAVQNDPARINHPNTNRNLDPGFSRSWELEKKTLREEDIPSNVSNYRLNWWKCIRRRRQSYWKNFNPKDNCKSRRYCSGEGNGPPVHQS